MESSTLSPAALSEITSRCVQSGIVESFKEFAGTSASHLSQIQLPLLQAIQEINKRLEEEPDAADGGDPGYSVSVAEWTRHQWVVELHDLIDCLQNGRELDSDLMEDRVEGVSNILEVGVKLETDTTFASLHDIEGLYSMMGQMGLRTNNPTSLPPDNAGFRRTFGSRPATAFPTRDEIQEVLKSSDQLPGLSQGQEADAVDSEEDLMDVF